MFGYGKCIVVAAKIGHFAVFSLVYFQPVWTVDCVVLTGRVVEYVVSCSLLDKAFQTQLLVGRNFQGVGSPHPNLVLLASDVFIQHDMFLVQPSKNFGRRICYTLFIIRCSSLRQIMHACLFLPAPGRAFSA